VDASKCATIPGGAACNLTCAGTDYVGFGNPTLVCSPGGRALDASAFQCRRMSCRANEGACALILTAVPSLLATLLQSSAA
jgi:hypothetical protein